MTCEQDLEQQQRINSQYRLELGGAQLRLAMAQQFEAYAMAGLAALNQGRAATATGSTGPATRPTTQPQEERRGVGDGEMAQYAALMRDIVDMETRLDRLEAK